MVEQTTATQLADAMESIRSLVRVNRVIANRKAAPSADYTELSQRLARRQSIGGVGPVPANDNQAWPLAEQLRRDGNEVLLAVAERYQQIYRAAVYEPKLVGTVADDFWSPEQRHSVGEDGVIRRKGAKSGKNSMPSDDGAYKVEAISEDRWEELTASGPVTFPRRPKSPAMGKWNGDAALIASIDARPVLRKLQAALGPLVDPFEDAVITGMTFTEIGREGGIGQHAAGAGKYAVMLGLSVVQSELAKIDRSTAA